MRSLSVVRLGRGRFEGPHAVLSNRFLQLALEFLLKCLFTHLHPSNSFHTTEPFYYHSIFHKILCRLVYHISSNLGNLHNSNELYSFYSPHNLRKCIFTASTDIQQNSSDTFHWISRMNRYFVASFTLIFV